ncbi:hypothetical protein Glove_92g99 [Diversispora epigaea]|uniref:Uncharacterized protein n=1 Tax=Diversispora epigaea TaxID=1348612 RepID=A0A397J8V9_9GLOM|nr:hypothetical protein Glove_92g99 [Diversispora epigaea]
MFLDLRNSVGTWNRDRGMTQALGIKIAEWRKIVLFGLVKWCTWNRDREMAQALEIGIAEWRNTWNWDREMAWNCALWAREMATWNWDREMAWNCALWAREMA